MTDESIENAFQNLSAARQARIRHAAFALQDYKIRADPFILCSSVPACQQTGSKKCSIENNSAVSEIVTEDDSWYKKG